MIGLGLGIGITQQQAGDSTPEPAVFQPGLGALLFNEIIIDSSKKTELWNRILTAGYHFSAWLPDGSLATYNALTDAAVKEFVNTYGNEYQVYMSQAANAFRLADGEHLEAHITDAVAAGGLTVIDDPAPTFAGQKAAVLTVDMPVDFDYATDGTEVTSGAKVIGGSTIAGLEQLTAGVYYIPPGETGVPAAMCEIPLWWNGTKLLFGIWDAHTYVGEAGGFTSTDAITLYKYGEATQPYGYEYDLSGLAAYIQHWNYIAENRATLGTAPSGWSESLAKGFHPTQQEIVAAAKSVGLDDYYATGSYGFMYFKKADYGAIGHHQIDLGQDAATVWAEIATKTRAGQIVMSQLSDYSGDSWSVEAGDWAKLDYVLAKCLEYEIPVMLPSQLPHDYYDNTTALYTNSLPSLTTDLINETPTEPTGWDWTAAANAVPNLATGEVTINQTGTILSIEDFYAWKRGINRFTIKMKNDGTAADVITVTIAGIATNPTFSVNGTSYTTFTYDVPIAQTYAAAIDIDVVVTTKNSTGVITVKEPTFAYINDIYPPVITVSTDDPISVRSKHTITCATASAKIYYTTDGTTPTTGSTLYTGTFTVAAGTGKVIKAIAYDTTGTYFYGDGTTPTVVSSAAFTVSDANEAETTALLSAMGVSAPTDTDILAAYDQLFYDLRHTAQGDMLAKLDCLELFYTAHSDQTDAMLNVIAPTGYAATLGHGANPSADPTWAAKAGFTTDATNWVNTGFIPSAGSKYDVQSGDGSCMGIVQHTDPTASNLYEFGAQAAAGATTACLARLREAANGNVLGKINGGTSYSSAAINSTTKKYLLMTRLAGGGAFSIADENGFVTSAANAEGTIPDVAVYIGGYNNNGTFASGKIAFPAVFFAGSAMTELQWIAFRTAIATYLAAMAAI